MDNDSERMKQGVRGVARAMDRSLAPCCGISQKRPETSKFGHGGPRANAGGLREPPGGRPRKPDAMVAWDGPRWCAYATHPQAERLAASELTRAGYRSYAPLIAMVRRDPVVHSIAHKVLAPRFQGYGFVELGPTDPWQPVRVTAGIRAMLLGPTGRIVPIPVGVIERHQADDAALCNLARETMPRLLPGLVVAIDDGAFAGHSGIVVACDGLVTAVSLELFGRMVDVRLARGSVRQ